MSIGPSVGVSGVLTASPPVYHLLRAPGVSGPLTIRDYDAQGNIVESEDTRERWQAGVETDADNCNIPLDVAQVADGDWPYWWECPDTAAGGGLPENVVAGGIKRPAAPRALVHVDPIQVWASYQCSSHDLHDGLRRSEVEARVRRKFAAMLPVAAERELESAEVAEMAGFPNAALRDLTAVWVNAAPLGFVTALAELEQALATSGNQWGRRFIHAQPRVVTAWASQLLVAPSPDGTHLRTALGTIVVPGTGYTGAPPGEVGSSSFVSSVAYGTGPVRVLVSTPDTRDLELSIATVDRSINDAELRMEASMAIIWDPCVHFAARVNLCDEYCGAGS